MIRDLFSPGNQIKLGALLSYATLGVTNVVGILLTPFIVRSFGQAEFGLYVLMGSLISYMTVLDFGLNNTIVRYVAKYRAEHDMQGEEKFLATVMAIYFGISLLVLFCGYLVYLNLDSVFGRSLTIEEFSEARIMFVVLILNIAFTLPGNAFGAICNGYERFVFPRTITLARYVVRSMMVVALLLFGGKAVSLVILDTLMNLSGIVINAFYVVTKIKTRIHFRKVEISFVKKILGYSVWIFVFAIVSQFQWQTGQVVLGILSGTKLVAIYGIGVVLGTYYGAFSTAISGLFLPRATQMVTGQANSEELTSMWIKVGRMSLLVLFYVLGAFILYGRDFIVLWVGEGYNESWLVALLIMIGYTTPLTQNFANSILEARAMLSFKAVLYLSMTAIGALFGALLVTKHGVTGMVVGSIAAWLVSQLIMNVYYHKVLKLNVQRFFRELLDRIFISFVVVLVVCWSIYFHDEVTWSYFILNVMIYSTIYAAAIFSYGMKSDERHLIFGRLGRFAYQG